MNSDVAISVKNLTKTYRLFGHPGDRIKQFFSFGLKQYHREFTALNDVSFQIKKGETIGIIGRNGSGKSTLLQLICGILKPTTGVVQINGKIAALLELGAGFNPEFTGRENVYFQGAVLGISNKEMDDLFEEIIAFADIGEFIDEPVRVYSSGMYVRLAFASAIHCKASILIIDEALSVGDESFQRKCFEKIHQFRQRGGTLIYVTHNMASVVELCDYVILFNHGKIVESGIPKIVAANYLKEFNDLGIIIKNDFFQTPANEEIELNYFDMTLVSRTVNSYPNSGAQITNPRILSTDNKLINMLRTGEEYVYAYDTLFNISAENVRFGMMVKTTSGYELGGLTSHPEGAGISVQNGTKHSQRFRFRCNFLPGTYFLNAGIVCSSPDIGDKFMHRLIDAAVFKVISGEKMASGIVNISPTISIVAA